MEDYKFPHKPVANSESVIQGENFRLTILTDGLVRCEWSSDGKFEDRASTFAINRDLPVPKFRVVRKDNYIDIFTERFHLTYDQKPFSPSGLTVNVLGGLTDHKSRWRYGESYETLGGTARTLDGVNGRCELDTAVISRHGHAMIDDSTSMLFDDQGWIASRLPGSDRKDIYVFAYGLDYSAAIDALYRVSGSQPAIPRWALGNWWSRYHAYSDKEYLALMDKFKAHKIPLSIAVIDMDWHRVTGDDITHSGWTGYSWEPKLFPDPAAFLKALKERNLRVTPNDHPAEGIHSYEDVYETMAKQMGHDTSHKDPIQFDCTDPKFMQAYLDMFRSLGFDFDWIDWQQGTFSRMEGVDPLWMLNHYHFLDNKKINPKPLIFSRYAGPGSHRYPVGFSGDSLVSWESLHFQPEFTACASNIGYGWWSHDIGGHMLGVRDDEMATRWLQLGVFSPLLRLHSTVNRWASKEPWLFQKEYELIMADSLRLRHRLIPYLHTMNVRANTMNEPLVTPLYWVYPKREEAYNFPNQFFFGTHIMVVPITTPRSKHTTLSSVQAWLPPGPRWIDIFSGIVYDSDRTVTLHRPLSQYPVLVREGTIIPMDGAEAPGNGAKNPKEIELVVAIGSDATFELIEDVCDDELEEGSKLSPTRPGQRITNFKWVNDKQRIQVHPAKVEGCEDEDSRLAALNYTRTYKFRYVSADPYASMAPTEPPGDGGPAVSNDIIARSDESTTIKASESLDMGLQDVPENPPLPVLNNEERLHRIINSYQVDYMLKVKLWEALSPGKDQKPAAATLGAVTEACNSANRGYNVGLLAADEMDHSKTEGFWEDVIGPIREVLLADSRPPPS